MEQSPLWTPPAIDMNELESSAALEGLAKKLPDSLLSRWGRQVTRLFTSNPTLRDLDLWLDLDLMGMKNVQSARSTVPETPAVNPPSQFSNRNQQERSSSYWNRQGKQASHHSTTQQNQAALLSTFKASTRINHTQANVKCATKNRAMHWNVVRDL
jgi:hypothetical protein